MRTEAAEFARTLAISHLATVEGDAPVVRVMHAFRVDDDLSVWYACGASSNKVRQIRANPRVAVSFWQEKKDLVLSGTAQIVEDPQVKADMWEEGWERHFPKGKEDPEYCLLKITASQALYRDLDQHGFTAQGLL
jgi:general stress protein 26